jgi:nucleotide-binding universal stress UspA family protein
MTRMARLSVDSGSRSLTGELWVVGVGQSLATVNEHHPIIVAKGEHIMGSPGAALVEASQGASLLVIGSRGHSEIANLIFGSVSERCVHHAGSPTTIVG